MATIKSDKVKTLDIELAIMREFDFRTNLIVPNISSTMNVVPFETDMLVLNKNSYAHGFEIKVSKSDLKADFKKRHHKEIDEFRNGKTGKERFYGKFKHFSYAVPEELSDYALGLIPAFCGLYAFKKQDYPYIGKFYCVRKPKRLFNYQWSNSERYEVARLGTMRIYNLKRSIFLFQSPNER